MALVRQFHWGLKEDIKDLLLTMPNESTLPKAIFQAIKCNNRLFERRHNKRLGSQNRVPSPYPKIPSNTINSQHEPM